MTDRRVVVTLDANTGPYDRAILASAAKTRTFARDLEQADSRMANLVQSGLALAPAIVPITAAAVPAIAGLTSALGFTVAAAGTTILAFGGVGDALTALNEFQIDPTSDNLAKLNEKLDALGPAGEVFVRQLQAMRPELQKLQDIAQEELFPGMAEGLEELLHLGPRAERVIGSIAGTMGDLFAEAGDNLNDPRWREFFRYLEREAGPVLSATAKSAGNLVEGITNLVMATDPMSDDFLEGMLENSRDFVKWSDELDSTEGYQNFLDYISDNGPQAMATLGAIGSALVSIVQATAPVGSAVLPILEDLANVLSDFMDTPAGPVIVAAAAAIGTLGRSMALLKAVGLRNGDSIIGKALGVSQIKPGIALLREANTATKDLSLSQRAQAMIAVSQEKAVRTSAAQMGKNVALAGGLAAVTSGLTDDVGLSNTALLGMAGTMAGPWGGAVGAGVGLFLDIRSAGDDVAEMMARLDKTVDGSADSFDLQRQAISQARAEIIGLQNDAYDPSFGQNLQNAFSPDFWAEIAEHAGDGSELYGDEIDKINAKTNELVESEDALYQLGLALGMGFKKNDNGSIAFAIDDLDRVATRVQPALDALGLTLADIAGMDYDEQKGVAGQIADWLKNADSASGRTEALADSFRGLDDEMLSVAESAFDMKESLDALLSPGLNVSAATDAWRDGLRNLNDELDKNNGSLFANTDAASQNRAELRSRVQDFQGLLVAEAEAGAGSARLSGLLKNQRKALIDAGVAAGIGRGEMVKYVDQLGLTPKMVKTVIEAQVKNAEADVERVRARLAKLNGMKSSPKVDAQIAQAEAKLKRLLGLIDSVKPKTVEIDVTTFYREERIGGPRAKAAQGRYIRGPGTTTSDSIPALLSDKEYVNKAAAVEKYGVAMFDDINAMRFPRPKGYAGGGLLGGPGRLAGGGILGTQTGSNSEILAVMQAAQAVRELVKSLAKDGKDRLKGNARNIAEQELKVARDTLREAQKGVGQAVRDKAAEVAQQAAQTQLDAATKQQDAAKTNADWSQAIYDDLFARRESAVSGTAANALGGGLDFSNLGAFDKSLTGEANNAAGFDATIKALIDAGLDGALLEKVGSEGNLKFANQLLASGAGGIDYYEGLYAQANASALSAGGRVGSRNYDADLALALASSNEQLSELQTLNAKVDQLTAVTAGSPERTGAAVSQGVNKVAKKAGHHKKPKVGRIFG